MNKYHELANLVLFCRQKLKRTFKLSYMSIRLTAQNKLTAQIELTAQTDYHISDPVSQTVKTVGIMGIISQNGVRSQVSITSTEPLKGKVFRKNRGSRVD